MINRSNILTITLSLLLGAVIGAFAMNYFAPAPKQVFVSTTYQTCVGDIAANQAMVPPYKGFTLDPGDNTAVYYGSNLSNGKMSITRVDLVTGENSTPFGEGWIEVEKVKVDGYTFTVNSDRMLVIVGESWYKSIGVWDIHQFGEFIDGNFIVNDNILNKK